MHVFDASSSNRLEHFYIFLTSYELLISLVLHQYCHVSHQSIEMFCRKRPPPPNKPELKRVYDNPTNNISSKLYRSFSCLFNACPPCLVTRVLLVLSRVSSLSCHACPCLLNRIIKRLQRKVSVVILSP